MNDLGYVESLALGVLQGITEFLPISSSAHLALAQRWLKLDPNHPTLLLFDVLAHIATLLAVLVVFREPISRLLRAAVRDGKRLNDPRGLRAPIDPPGSAKNSERTRWAARPALRIILLAIVACVPTGVIGLMFKDTFESAFDRPTWIGVCLLITGTLLGALAVVPRGRRGWRSFRWWQAALVGVAQAGAILPGISRSGATLCVASYCGLRRQWAAEFSFLIAAPAILGGTLLKLRDTLALPPEQFQAIPWGPLLVGAGASFLVGMIALRVLLTVVRRAKLHYFALYCWMLGVYVLVVLR